MRYQTFNIVLLSIVVEGFLASFYLLYLYLGDSPAPFAFTGPSFVQLVAGVCGSIPLFIANYFLFGPFAEKIPFLRPCHEFKDRIVRPLAAELDIRSGLIVACCAGIGEELFFRGLLQSSCGIFVASLAFSLMHFGPAVTKFPLIASIYFLIGLYFGLLYEWAGTLWIPVIAHASYDYVALVYMRYFYPLPDDPLAPPRGEPLCPAELFQRASEKARSLFGRAGTGTSSPLGSSCSHTPHSPLDPSGQTRRES